MAGKRVCILRMGWQPFIDGPLGNLIDALAGRGIETTLLKSRARADLGLPEEIHPKADCQLFQIWLKRFSKTPVLRPAILFLGWFEFILRLTVMGLRAKPGVVIAIDVDTLPAGWLIARLGGAKLIFYSYELYTDRPGISAKPFWNLLERLFIRRADLVVACEPNRARVLHERYHLAECPMAVLNVPPRNTEHKHSRRIQEFLQTKGLLDAKVAYFHGWINRSRCADVFVRAMKHTAPNVVLFFVGPIEETFKQELLQLAHDLGVENRVIFRGVVPSEELMDYPASADLGLQAQLNVGLNSYYCAPIKLFQYLSVGLPVIGSNFPGMLDVIEKNHVGVCVNPESEDEIAAAINRVLGDDALYRQLSENAFRAAQEKYCYEVEGKPLLDTMDNWL